ncbi:hypothetical protein BDU57DRAFT_522498 [Ampelomyces quisqualis]|uniref:C3H1-type domain-containing protein n=1 Tax=Ampelomyces quisqualis TaxID=50730 RepID=A0A6A5QBU4_AMPQU|nr:hypothetical protein BDU57DRAFT_522498 [Ampelomyces quisqualis]
MAGPGPPPYSLEEIQNMTTPEERLRARAELTSYIVRMKKEKQERLARESHHQDGYPSYASGPPTSPFRPGTGAGYTRNYNGYEGAATGYRRGGYTHSRGAHSAYHPYQRRPSALATQKFRNKSVVFNKGALTGEIPDGTPASVSSTTASALPEQGVTQHNEPQTLCPAFTMTGVCSRHGCRHLHDPDKLAICKRWLFKGICPKGDSCPLSHDSSAHNAPTCQHFQEGRCNNDNCRFSHVRVNPAALNCEAFGLLGYCEKGTECSELHAHECPQFSNTGVCPFGDKCRLGHVYRAARMRKAARVSPEGQPSHEGSPRDVPDNTADSETWIGGAARDTHHFTQQVDFVSLNTDD